MFLRLHTAYSAKAKSDQNKKDKICKGDKNHYSLQMICISVYQENHREGTKVIFKSSWYITELRYEISI